MPTTSESPAHLPALQVLGASVDHRAGEVRLLVRTDSGATLLAFSPVFARQIGRDLIAPPKTLVVAPCKTAPRGPRSLLSAAYLAVATAAEANPDAEIKELCAAAGLRPNRFYAWRSYQRLCAKRPVLKPSGRIL